jgi:hypothetical protein
MNNLLHLIIYLVLVMVLEMRQDYLFSLLFQVQGPKL